MPEEQLGSDLANPTINKTYRGRQIIHDPITTPGIVYIGIAKSGVSKSSNNWYIYIIDRTTGMDHKKEAEANDKANKIWNERTSYSYS